MKPYFTRTWSMLLFVLLLSYTQVSAQIYRYTNTLTGAPNIVAANATGSNLTRVNGLASSTACATGFTSVNWSTAGIVILSAQALEITVTPNAGYYLNMTSFTSGMRRNTNGPPIVRFAYSTDGGVTWVQQPTYQAPFLAGCGSVQVGTWDFPDFSVGSAIKFRIYGFSAVNSTGQLQIINLNLNGTVSTTPIGTPATITSQPSALTVCEGQSATFTVAAAGVPAPTLQWQVSNNGGVSWSNISGQTSTTYSFTTSIGDNGKKYRAYTSNTGGSDTSASVLLTVNPLATVNAGSNASICEGSSYTLAGSIGGGASSATWSSAGDGTFANPSVLNTTYTPGPADISNGSVLLTLTTNDPAGPCGAAFASMILTIDDAATVNAGLDQSVCAGGTVSVSGSIGGSATSASWTTSGDGVFLNSNSLITIYTPGTTDLANGTVSLTLTTNDPAGVCGPVSDALIVTIQPVATANAGSNASICEGSSYTLSGAIGGAAVSATWSTAGDGSFANTSQLNTTYTPGSADIANGTVVLTLTTNDPAGPCGAAVSTMTLTIDDAATVNAGADISICENGSAALSGSIGGSATSATWTTSGDGSFVNSSSLTTTYNPGSADIIAGTVTLTLTTNDPSGVCGPVADALTLTVQTLPLVDAGLNQNICSSSAASLSGSVSGSATSGTWSSAGDGSFNNANLLNAVYTPGPNDILNGSVILTLTSADPAGPCGSVSDQVTITITSPPAVPGAISGLNDVCPGTNGVAYSIAPVPGATSYIWTSLPWVTINGGGTNVTMDFATNITNSGTFIWVRAANGCGVSADSSKRYIRHAIDKPTFVTPQTVVCPNTTGVLYKIKEIQGYFTITWSVPAGCTFTNLNDSMALVDFGPSFTGGSITVTATHLCVTTTQSVTVTPGTSKTPAAISGPAYGVCDSTVTYSIAPVSGAVSYLWTAPANATIIGPANGLSVTVQFNPAFTLGVLSVVSLNSCSIASSPRNLTVRGNPQAPSAVSGPSTVCAFQAGVVFSVTPVPGAWSYSWTIPSSATLVSGQGTTSITVNFGANGGNINVRSVRPCGTSGAFSKGVTVNCRLSDLVSGVTVSPNPAGDQLQVLGIQSTTEELNYQVLDVTGRLVASGSWNSGDVYRMSVSELQNGHYLLHVFNNEIQSSTGFIVAH